MLIVMIIFHTYMLKLKYSNFIIQLMGQFSALLWKNWLLYKRGLIGACFQFIVPIAAVAFILLIKHLITITTYPAEQYWNNPAINATYKMIGTPSMINPYIDNCLPQSVIALTPQGDPLINLLNNDLIANNYTTKLFSSDENLNSYVRAQNYGVNTSPICFGITSVSFSGPNFSYKLRFNVSNIASNTAAPPTNQQITSDEALQLTLFKRIANSGYLGINTLIETLILEQFSGSSNIQNTIGPIYQEEYIDDPTYQTLGNSIQILVLLPLLVIYLRQVSLMLSQKQNKIRETMSIMGMNKLYYYFTWFIRFFSIYVIVHLICSAILAYAFQYINYGTFILVYITFDLVLIIQAFFIQIFFSRSKIGVVFALVFFVIQYVLSFIVTTSNNPTLLVNFVSSIVPHIGFILAFRTMLYAQSDQIYLGLTEQKNFYVILIAVFFFVANFIVYLILTWYLDQVFPNEWGSRKHPLFCCFSSRRNKINQGEDNLQVSQQNKIQQEIDQNMVMMEKLNETVKIRNLTKQFSKDVLAVDKLNATFYKDQIFALLGHNGAGKTTTISMLTGMLDPTNGYIGVLGQTDVQNYRKFIGVCPQHDTLYNDLTVYQHLYLFGAFRGLSGSQLKEQIQKLVQDVNLEEKKYEFTKNLSGGQKRRLSVAMAFTGKSKVIILDQPTSGMDTSARRYIWDMLEANKKDRIMILTTHFMDEADYLGDRIGIMGSGKLICCGSSIYLKNKFGVGYNITIVKQKSDTPSEPIISLIHKYIAKSTIVSDVGSQLAMQLPLNQLKKFQALFNELDNEKQKLRYLTYGISITTLQQVFLKVSQQAKTLAQQDHHYRVSLRNSKHDQEQRKNELKQIMIPLQAKIQDTEAKEFDESLLIKEKKILFNFLRHIWATILKRLRVIRRDIKGFIFELILPIIILILALLLMRISFITDFPSRTLNIQTLAQDSSPVTIGIGGSNTIFTNAISSEISAQYQSIVNILTDTQDQNTSSFDLNFLKNKETQYFRGGIFLNPQIGNTYSFSSVINTRAISSSIILPNLATQAIINSINSSNYTITAINDPLPRTYQQLSINNTISGFFAAFIFTLAFSFKFASVISFIVKQRTNKSKNQQIVSGINIGSYWLGNFIYDYFLYLILAVFTCLMILAFDIQGLREENGYAACWIIFILFGLVYIPFTYIGAFLFDDYGTAQAAWYFFTFVCGGLLPLITLLLRIVSVNTVSAGNGLAWALRIIPAFSFGQGLINIGSLVILEIVAGGQFTAFNMTIALAPIIYLACGTILYPFLLFLIEKISSNQTLMRLINRQSSISQTNLTEDNDVKDEKQKALNAKPEDFIIVTKNLRKVYRINGKTKYKVAVDNVSFSISEGEVFGLLGVNGAGKTTTFKMLSGDITSTSGQCYLMGISVNHNIQQIRQNLGYCPQFDALVDNLTVRQQLQLYYDIKCLPYKYKTEAINIKIQEMDLQDYEDKLSGNLSGGNKRKLSVAMAMIGNPKIIFLDQPSTGMDPKARRFMWKVISRIATEKKQSTIILTTHSMQQAEALSTKLSIMVKGNFKCIGTPQHIKSKYGDGFQIQIRLNPPSKQEIEKMIIQKQLSKQINKEQIKVLTQKLQIPLQISSLIQPYKPGGYLLKSKKISVEALIQFYFIETKVQNLVKYINQNIGFSEVLQSYQTYVRLKTRTKIGIGKMFGQLEKCRQQSKILQYSIKQASVEQIFNKFAQEQNIQEQE